MPTQASTQKTMPRSLSPGEAAELRSYLRRSLAGALRGQRLTDHDLDDFVQDALVCVLENLHTFRGESRLTTWATAVAIRVAYSALRRRRYRDRLSGAEPAAFPDHGTLPHDPSHTAERRLLTEALHRAIETALTKRQRIAVLGELNGVPSDELANRLGITRNALYKLHHDARKKLRTAILASGVTENEIRDALVA